mmetsp:Transcript_27711/g.49212  ORF Transcript_27711/g.49212 Transcript_27711/m.49212 type:complete len:214 (+) Transcript_27711:1-642(+)
MNQLEHHPTNRQWILELGGNFQLVRQGNVLSVVSGKETTHDKNEKNDNKMVPWAWSLVGTCNNGDNDETAPDSITTLLSSTIEICLPTSSIRNDLAFYSTTLGHAGSSFPSFALQFVPPWRNSPVKIRQFLRGQNIPVHLRDDVPILMCKSAVQSKKEKINDNKPDGNHGYQLVAVQIQDQKWVVHKDFACGGPTTDGGNSDCIKIALKIDVS